LSDVPKVTFTRLLGFIDILNHIGAKADVAAISSKEQLGLNDILPILETGQMLSLIEVKSGDVSITEKGYSLLAASTPLQQKIILKQITSLAVLAIIASVIIGVHPVPTVKAASCPYSAAAQSTGKIVCTPGGYILSPNPTTGIPSIQCQGGDRMIQTALSGPHARVLQLGAC
jgi:hypothetical protein